MFPSKRMRRGKLNLFRQACNVLVKNSFKKSNITRRYIKRQSINHILNPHLRRGTRPGHYGIPGLNRAFNSQNGRIVKAISVIVIFVIYVICVYQVIVRIKTYFEDPISINVVVESRQFLDFPTITICPWYPLKFNKELRHKHCPSCDWQNHKKHNIFDLLVLPNITVQSIWDYASIKPSIIHQWAGTYNLLFTSEFHLIQKEVKTLIGTCLSTTFAHQIRYRGGYVIVTTDLRNTSNEDYWHHMIILHEDMAELPQILVNAAGIPVHHNFETDVTLSIKESDYVNTRNNPCKSPVDFRECITRCAVMKILANITCKLPYLEAPLLPDCINSSEARHTYIASLGVYMNIDKLCNECQRPCHVIHYGVTKDCIKEYYATRLNVMLSNNFVERISENASYNFVMFLGDIGGTVGFFLGMCLLNVVDMFTLLIAWLSLMIKNS